MNRKKVYQICSAPSKYITKDGDLNYLMIEKAFREANALFVDGAIIEARDICIDIVNAINLVERNYGGA